LVEVTGIEPVSKKRTITPSPCESLFLISLNTLNKQNHVKLVDFISKTAAPTKAIFNPFKFNNKQKLVGNICLPCCQ